LVDIDTEPNEGKTTYSHITVDSLKLVIS